MYVKIPGGIHVDKVEKTYVDSIKYYQKEFGIKTAQINFVGPRNLKVNVAKELDELRNLTNETGLNLWNHCDYLSPIWDKDATKVKRVNTHIKLCRQAGATGIVLHLKKMTVDKIIDAVKTIYESTQSGLPEGINNKTIEKNPVRIALEMTAVHADTKNKDLSKNLTYETPEKINNLCKAIIDAKMQDTVGICIDTSHIWASGIDVSNYTTMKEYFDKMEYPNMIYLIHLNSNINPRDGGKDNHAIIDTERDTIWKDYKSDVRKNAKNHYKKSGLKAIIDAIIKHEWQFVCERSKDKEKTDLLKNEIKLLESIVS